MVKKVTERWVKNKAVEKLKRLGVYYFFPIASGYMRAGVPDIIACYKGKFIGIECKANGNKPTALQQKNLREISIQGGISLLIDETNVDMLEFYVTGKQTFNYENL